VRAIAAGRRFAVVPWQMGVVASVLHVLPRWLYDALFARAPRKPRQPERPERPDGPADPAGDGSGSA